MRILIAEDEKSLNRVVTFENKLEFPSKMFRGKSRRETRDQFVETLEAINNFAREYNCLRRVLTEDGYIAVIDNIFDREYCDFAGWSDYSGAYCYPACGRSFMFTVSYEF